MDSIQAALDTIIYKIVTTENLQNSAGQIRNETESISSLVAHIPSIIALITMVISVFLVFYKIRLDNAAQIKREFILDRYRNNKTKLEKFYNPIFILLEMNTKIFNEFGPSKLTLEDDQYNSDLMKVWDNLVDDVIIPNNNKIVGLITNNSYLLNNEDNHDLYINLITHIKSYEQNKIHNNQIHKNYKYNTTYIDNVRIQRNIVLSRINDSIKK